jgi:hypothetical protein
LDQVSKRFFFFQTMPHSRRYHYSHHDGSPHIGMINFLIGLAVILCLWNVWTAPPPTSATTTTTASSSTMRNDSTTYTEILPKSDNNMQQEQQERRQQEPKRLQLVREIQPHSQISVPVEKSYNGIRLLPVQTASNGQKFILLASERGQEADTKAIVSVNELGKVSDSPKAHSLPTPYKSSFRKKQVHTNRKGLSTPLFVDTVTYESSSSSAFPGHYYRPNWSSWLYGIAVSGSILAGGLLAIRALKRMEQWEQLSKEDSLAFDVAYTSTYKDDVDSYGSFEPFEWSGDRLDRFDV